MRYAAAPTTVAAVLVSLCAAPTRGQVRPPPDPSEAGTEVRVVPGIRYRAGALKRFFDGDNRRDLWTRELAVPVLDLHGFAGGLEPEERGGNQSKTLHFQGADGRTYIFRSVDKFARGVLPEDLQGTALNDLMQDHVSIFHPGAALVVPRLHEALGLLALPPVLRVMPDDPELGEYRETFAGMLGQVVERPNEGPHGEAWFAGSHRIVGTDELLEKLEEHPRNQVAAEEYLADRLIDFLVGDTDRGPDQWRWARVPMEAGFVWRPIVRDRDWAFMHANGVVAHLAGLIYPKVVEFEDEYPDIEALTWADVGLGRRLLTSLDRTRWEAVVRRVQGALTDSVIDEAVDRLPPEMKPGHAPELAGTLKARRDRLGRIADTFYERLATDVDVRATDMPDRAEIERRADGTVEVTLLAPAPVLTAVVPRGDEEDDEEHAADPYYDPDFDLDEAFDDGREPEAWAPYYRRVFRPSETDEVRVFLHGGDDAATVRGSGSDIVVRVIGGGGEDVLRDESGSGHTVLYDEDEGDLLEGGPATRVDRRPFDAPEPEERFSVERMGYGRHRDWGAEWSKLSPTLDFREGAGVIVGAGPTWTQYGFRHQPYEARLALRGLVSLETGGLGADASYERWLENEPVGLRLHGRATGFEAVRFYGYGNASPPLPAGDALVYEDRALVEAALVVRTPSWELSAGPVARYTSPELPAASPADPGLPGTDAVLEVGGGGAVGFDRVDHENVPTRGVRLDLGGSGFPSTSEAGGWGRATAQLRGYVPVPLPLEPVLAVRLGARRAWGDFPIHGAARIGGSGSLRGYRWQRFAGDAALYGSAELRVPLFRANLYLARGRLGVIGLADAGRVYMDGASPGDWHTGHGAGVFFETLHTAVYGLWARGEEDRFYVGLGLPY